MPNHPPIQIKTGLPRDECFPKYSTEAVTTIHTPLLWGHGSARNAKCYSIICVLNLAPRIRLRNRLCVPFFRRAIVCTLSLARLVVRIASFHVQSQPPPEPYQRQQRGLMHTNAHTHTHEFSYNQDIYHKVIFHFFLVVSPFEPLFGLGIHQKEGGKP